MSHQFAISPDVHARDLSAWFILNTRIQRITNEAFHPTPHDDFRELHQAIAEGAVDLIFANSADTALLVREHGFVPLARPSRVSDEGAVVVAADSPMHSLDDVPSELSVAATDAPDIERICRILLEPADLSEGGLQISTKRNYILVAKAVISGETQAGFFLKAALDELSDTTRSMLRPLITSRIYVAGHALLASPAIDHLRDSLSAELFAMSQTGPDGELLAGLGAPNGWEPMSIEDAEFMADLMETLAQ